MNRTSVHWGKRAWVPQAGMLIRYRADLKLSDNHDPSTVGEIVAVLPGNILSIKRTCKGVTKSVTLSESTWKSVWEPIPSSVQDVPGNGEVSAITESDVRRIVREEIDRKLEVVADALGKASDWILAGEHDKQ